MRHLQRRDLNSQLLSRLAGSVLSITGRVCSVFGRLEVDCLPLAVHVSVNGKTGVVYLPVVSRAGKAE